jgi:hypothetical protein
MKKFLAVYVGSQTGPNFTKWKAQDEPTQKKQMDAGKKAWMAWGETNSRSILDHGGPLGKTKQIGPDGIKDIKNNLTGYAIVEAESQEAAAKLFLSHPHFMVFPGDTVEVVEIMPMPGM